MIIQVKTLADDALENVIRNHRTKKRTDSPLYLEALAEQARRKGRGLDFATSLAVIKQAAADQRFISYKDLADASGAEWSKVHYAVGDHLYRLVEYCHRTGMPLLSAIVVNKPNIATGRMDPDTLRGFTTAARLLGYPVTDESEFLKDQQRRTFEWGQSGRADSPKGASTDVDP